MINKSILSALVVVGISFAPFGLAQVLSTPPENMENERDVNTGQQDDPRIMRGPQSDPHLMRGPQDGQRMMLEPGGGHPGMMDEPQRGLIF